MSLLFEKKDLCYKFYQDRKVQKETFTDKFKYRTATLLKMNSYKFSKSVCKKVPNLSTKDKGSRLK